MTVRPIERTLLELPETIAAIHGERTHLVQLEVATAQRIVQIRSALPEIITVIRGELILLAPLEAVMAQLVAQTLLALCVVTKHITKPINLDVLLRCAS